jgi:hypothetical protein
MGTTVALITESVLADEPIRDLGAGFGQRKHQVGGVVG